MLFRNWPLYIVPNGFIYIADKKVASTHTIDLDQFHIIESNHIVMLHVHDEVQCHDKQEAHVVFYVN